MKRTFVIGLALIFGLALLAGSGPFENNAEAGKTTFVTIGTGGITGVYYPTGGAIARIRKRRHSDRRRNEGTVMAASFEKELKGKKLRSFYQSARLKTNKNSHVSVREG